MKKEFIKKIKEAKEEKEKTAQHIAVDYPEAERLSARNIIKYKQALETYPDLKDLKNTKLILLAYDFRQEQIKSYDTCHTTEYANARCNIQFGKYENENMPNDLPALSFEKECVVCWTNKKGINLCPECWQLIRKCLDIKGKSHREGWDGWGYEMCLDLSNLEKLLRTDEEGKKLLEEKIALDQATDK
ncbi:MAG: hypothetical protein WC662_00515 [Candidatus Paceibacterota bacterium]|jgi:hypothetical protein